MSADHALRQIAAKQLGVDPGAMKSVRVYWNDGDNYDPTYGDSPNSPPTFEVEVHMTDGTRVMLDTAWTFSALLAEMLGVENWHR